MQSQIEFRGIARFVLGVVFVASALLKMISLTNFELYLFSFGIGSFDTCSLFARLLIIGEAVLGFWIATGFARKWSNALTAFVLAAFSLFLVRNLLVGDNRSCNCFGSLIQTPPGVSLVKNAVMAIVLAVAWTKGNLISKVRSRHLLLAAVIVTASVFTLSPPDMYFRRNADREVNLSHSQWEDVVRDYSLPGKRIVCLFSTQCQHCINCVSKISGFVSRGECDESSVYEFFLRTTDDPMETMITDFNGEFDFQHDILPADIFISLTNGAFPIVLLTEDGRVVREYDYFSIDEQEVKDFFRMD